LKTFRRRKKKKMRSMEIYLNKRGEVAQKMEKEKGRKRKGEIQREK